MGISGLLFWLAVKSALTVGEYGILLPEAGAVQAGTGLLILLCTATFIFLIFQLAGSGTTAILLLFFLAVAMHYFAGGFLPSVFLPEAVRKVGRFLPVTYLIDAAGGLYTGTVSGMTVGILCLFTVLFGSAAYGVGRWRLAKEG